MSRAHQFLVLILIFVLAISSSCHALASSAKVTIKVVNEDGSPVEGARVGIGFDDYRNRNKENSVVGLSNDNGLFSGSAATTSGAIGFNITKQGYYKSTGEYLFKEKKLLRWEPWNQEIRIVLRKIGNPVPMYARKVTAILPATNKEIGFDLFHADWVAPYGAGSTADFNVSLEADDSGPDDFEYKVTIKFNGKMNGVYEVTDNILTGSSYKLPRLANDEGYQKSLNLMWRGLKRGQKRTWNQNRHYIYRVRAEEKDGRLLRAMYGKIVSDVRIVSNRREGKLPSVEFTYYLNPDYTRNLEFDTKHNLFGELPDLEKIRQP